MDNKKEYIIAILLVILVGSLCWYGYGYYNRAATADGRSAISTVEQLKDNNGQAESDNSAARNDISAATSEIQCAQSGLDTAGTDIDNARQSVSSLQESNRNDTSAIDDSNDLLDQLDATIAASKSNLATERSIVDSVDRGSKKDGASR